MDAYKAEQWLRTRATSLHCPACGQKNFNIENTIPMTNTLQEGGHVDYLNGCPLVAVICQNCAHVLFFAAKPMGLA